MPSRRGRNYESLEILRHKISMSQAIAEKDHEYATYAGASPEQAETMTLIDWALENKLIPEIPMLMKYRKLLEKEHKAHLAVYGSEITRLGFILGSPYVPESAIKQ